MYNPDDIVDPEWLAREGSKRGLTLTADQWREACEEQVASGRLIRVSGGCYAPADVRHDLN